MPAILAIHTWNTGRGFARSIMIIYITQSMSRRLVCRCGLVGQRQRTEEPVMNQPSRQSLHPRPVIKRQQNIGNCLVCINAYKCHLDFYFIIDKYRASKLLNILCFKSFKLLNNE